MASVRINRKGVYPVNSRVPDLTVAELPTSFDSESPVVFSGTVDFQAGPINIKRSMLLNRVSGSTAGASGHLVIGRNSATSSQSTMLLEITGAAGEGNRCGVMWHGTGSVLKTGNDGHETTPPLGAAILFYDSYQRRFKYRDESGNIMTLHVTGAI